MTIPGLMQLIQQAFDLFLARRCFLFLYLAQALKSKSEDAFVISEWLGIDACDEAEVRESLHHLELVLDTLAAVRSWMCQFDHRMCRFAVAFESSAGIGAIAQQCRVLPQYTLGIAKFQVEDHNVELWASVNEIGKERPSSFASPGRFFRLAIDFDEHVMSSPIFLFETWREGSRCCHRFGLECGGRRWLVVTLFEGSINLQVHTRLVDVLV